MEITWKEIAHGCKEQAYFCEGYSDLYHALFSILEQTASAKRDDLPLNPAQQAFVDLLETCWRERDVSGWTEATLLLGAGLHAAVLDGDPAAAGVQPFYATVGGKFVLENDLPAFQAALEQLFQQPGEILPWFLEEGRVQTNEISRGIAWLIPAYVLSAWQPDLTITLVDLGTSAGLNMAADHQSWQWWLADAEYTRNEPPYLMTQHLHPEHPVDPGLGNLLAPGALPPLPITQRVGFDRYPLHVENEAHLLSLRACIWGDQPDRMARFDQAVAGYQNMVANGVTPRFFAGDIIEAASLLPNLITDEIKPPHLLLVFNSAVTVYFDDKSYDRLRAELIHAFNRLPAGVQGLWLELEPPRYNEEVERPKHFMLKARLPFMGGVSTIYLGELEAHPTNFYLRPGWETLRGMLGM